MNERDFEKMSGPMKRRLQNMIARGVVKLSNAAKKMQAVQLALLADETSEDSLEHFEPYGFTSRPLPGAEAVTVFIDGDRSHGLCLVVADRRYRMTDFKEGEVAIHDNKGQSVHLTEDGIVVKGGGLPMIFEDTPSITFKAASFVRFETPRVETTQLLQAQQMTIGGVAGGVGAAVATMTGGTVNFTNVTFGYQGGAVTYTLTSIKSDGRRVDGGHVHPETGGTTAIPNP